MFRRRGLLIALVVLIIVVGGGAYYYFTVYQPEEISEEAPVQTSTARQGDITISATAAGTVIPASEVLLSFPINGVLTELLVQVGSKVQAGDVLALLDDSDAQQTLVNAQLQLAQTTMQTDASATQTGISYDDIAIAQARINLETVQGNLDDLLIWEPDPDEISQAEANLAAAQASYNAARGQEAASSSNIQVQSINLEGAQRDLAAAQDAYNTAYDPAREWEVSDPREGPKIEAERARAENNLQQAQDKLAIAEANHNSAIFSTNSSSSTSAQGNILSAELALVAAQNGPSEEDIEAAQMAIQQAELSLQQALLNQESNGLSLAQSQLNVDSAEAALNDAALIAPMDGTIMAINAFVGESAGAGVITLADLEQPLLEVYLDESDLSMVGLGYDVEVVFDALPNDAFTGQVIQVDPQLVILSGVTTVRALVKLDEDSFNKPQTLPVGMNATVEVIGGRAENAVLVPVEALRELSPGQFAVFVMEGGEPVLRFVEVGLMDFTFAEILSGLEAGETVTTGIVETQ